MRTYHKCIHGRCDVQNIVDICKDSIEGAFSSQVFHNHKFSLRYHISIGQEVLELIDLRLFANNSSRSIPRIEGMEESVETDEAINASDLYVSSVSLHSFATGGALTKINFSDIFRV